MLAHREYAGLKTAFLREKRRSQLWKIWLGDIVDIDFDDTAKEDGILAH